MQVHVILSSLFAASVIAHGVIVNPPSRKLGPGMTKLCGQTAFDIARGDVTASLETVAPNITEGCKSKLSSDKEILSSPKASLLRSLESLSWTSISGHHAGVSLSTRPNSSDEHRA